MDIFLGKVTQQAMNYAIRLTVEGDEKEQLEDLQERLDSKIRIISPAIDMIELISARGNTSLESAVSLTKSLRLDIQALGQRLARAASTDERARGGKLKTQEKAQHELELKRVIQSIKKLLNKIEDAVPLINLAITASGTNLSSNLPTTVSPSRLLQASTFLTAGDSQYSINPSQPVQIGPTFTLSMYMLFSGHIRPQYEEDIRESTWKEVIHKANVKLMRVPLDALYHLPGENRASHDINGSADNHSYFSMGAVEQARADEYAYQLLLVEDLEDDRVHTFEDGEPQPGPFGDVQLAGIREALPIHQVSKIFYADTGKILNIGTEGEVNSPILLLKRDVNAVPPRRMVERNGQEISPDYASEAANGSTDGINDYSPNKSQLIRAEQVQSPLSTPSTPSKGRDLTSTSNPWRLPQDLDPEWIAFEVYTESEDSDIESEPDVSSKKSRTSRTPSVEPTVNNAITRLQLKSSNTPSSPFTGSSTSQPVPQLPRIQTSLSLLETILRLLSLQQFQQTPHLSIPDELLTFFLSESASTGTASGDIEERKRLRDEARRRVGFDPYDESPIKRRGEEYQYRNHQDTWDDQEQYDGQPYTPEQASDNGAYQTPSHPGERYNLTYPSPSSAPARSSPGFRSPRTREPPFPARNERAKSESPSIRRGMMPGTPPVRWRPKGMEAGKTGSPLARPGTGFTDEGLGSSPPLSNRETPDGGDDGREEKSVGKQDGE
ncbi:MAG: hypothetical protein Q9222_007564 [Ikaeria aurantiellina]